MRSPAEAKAYLTELKLLLTYLGVSDCNMQEGSLRVDANINLHIDTPDGQDRHADRRSQEHEQLPGRRTGDGVRSRAAIRSLAGDRPEAGRRAQANPRLGRRRQTSPAASGTRKNRAIIATFPIPTWCRSPCAAEEVEAVRAALGELPAALRDRLEATLRHHALRQRRAGEPGPARWSITSSTWPTRCGDGKLASNWMQQDVLRMLKEQSLDIDRVSADAGRPAWPSCWPRCKTARSTPAVPAKFWSRCSPPAARPPK